MQTVLEILEKTTPWLAARGLAKPRLEAELLLAHVLGCRRLDLYLRFEDILPAAKLEEMRELIRRRGRREPLQYVLGTVDFFGVTLRVDRRALIPRPETEELAELLVTLHPAPPARFADLGTGSGALLLALAKRWPEARAVGIDRSPETLELARANASAAGLDGRVELRPGDWAEGLPGPFDLIVSNPPYLTEAEWAATEPEVREFEPRGALVAGADGLDDLRRILPQAFDRLSPGGLLALETGPTQHAALSARAAGHGYSRWESRRDLAGRERFFLAWR